MDSSSKKRKSNDATTKKSGSSLSSKKPKYQGNNQKSNKNASSAQARAATGSTGSGPSGKSKKPTPAASKNSSSSNNTNTDKENFAELVDTGKRVWIQLRLKTNTAAQVQELVMELIPLVTGRAHALSLRHDASRVVQAALQFGSIEQRRSIVQELCRHKTSNNSSGWLELCQSQYAHFVVLKVLTYCSVDAECWTLILKAFKGHVAKLAVHATASKVMEALFLLIYSPNQQSKQKQSNSRTARKEAAAAKAASATTASAAAEGNLLFLELYGPHVTLFASSFDNDKNSEAKDSKQKPSSSKRPTRLTLADHLERLSDKKDIILDFVRNLVNKGMEKQLYGFTYFQELLLEYCLVVPSSEVRALAVTGADLVIHLLSARAGTHVACLWIAYSAAKERKRILRSLKGYTRAGLLHKQAYLATLRLVQLTDDTVSIHKNLFAELTKPTAPAPVVDTSKPVKADTQDSPLLEIALSDTASKLFLLVLVDEVAHPEAYQKILDPYEHSVLFANPTVLENGAQVATSRKDASVRRNELLQYLREPLIQLCCQHAATLLRSIPGSAVLKEVYASLDRPSVLVDALLEVCINALQTKDSNGGDDDADANEGKEKTFLFEDITAHRALKALILVDAAKEDSSTGEGEDSDLSVAAQMVERITSDQWMHIANSNRGAFVVAAVGQIAKLKPGLMDKLSVPELERSKSKAKSGSTAGWEALLKVLQ